MSEWKYICTKLRPSDQGPVAQSVTRLSPSGDDPGSSLRMVWRFFEVRKSVIYDSSSSRICLIELRFQLFIAFTERRKEVPFSMVIGNGEHMHACFPKHLRMGTARMKLHKETEEKGKKRQGIYINRYTYQSC